MKKPLIAPKPIPVLRAAPLVTATLDRPQRVARPLAAALPRAARPVAAALRRVEIGVRVVVPTSIAARDLSAAIGMIVRRVRR